MTEDADLQLQDPEERELWLSEQLFPDFRRDRMETAEGEGRARARYDEFYDAIDEYTLSKAFGTTGLQDDAGDPVDLDIARDEAARDAVEEADLIGFWVAWHRAGGFAGLERAGWHRTTIFRRLRKFRQRYQQHPDVMEFGWVSLDLERCWTSRIDHRIATQQGWEPDDG